MTVSISYLHRLFMVILSVASFQVYLNRIGKLKQSEKDSCLDHEEGHISRNMRICLSLIDIAAPYI